MSMLIEGRFAVTRFTLEDCYEFEVVDTYTGWTTVVGSMEAVYRAIAVVKAW